MQMSRGRQTISFASLLFMANLLAQTAVAMPPGPSVENLIETSETVLGQEFAYPEGRARITAALVTVPPGAVLPPHLHPVPLFGYVLQGELVVDYGSGGEITYRKGDALVEAIDWPHQGRNGSRGILKILVVYAGAEGVPNTKPAELE
jgi:quercetin dioxygenase-like cupin family protein